MPRARRVRAARAAEPRWGRRVGLGAEPPRGWPRTAKSSRRSAPAMGVRRTEELTLTRSSRAEVSGARPCGRTTRGSRCSPRNACSPKEPSRGSRPARVERHTRRPRSPAGSGATRPALGGSRLISRAEIRVRTYERCSRDSRVAASRPHSRRLSTSSRPGPARACSFCTAAPRRWSCGTRSAPRSPRISRSWRAISAAMATAQSPMELAITELTPFALWRGTRSR
jgi:hypothetical protein